jgi:hypothetical protein
MIRKKTLKFIIIKYIFALILMLKNDCVYADPADEIATAIIPMIKDYTQACVKLDRATILLEGSSSIQKITKGKLNHIYKSHYLPRKLDSTKGADTRFDSTRMHIDAFKRIIGVAISYVLTDTIGTYFTTNSRGTGYLVPWGAIEGVVGAAPLLLDIQGGTRNDVLAVGLYVAVNAANELLTVYPLTQETWDRQWGISQQFGGRRRLLAMFNIPHRRPIFHHLDARDNNQYFAKCNEPTPTWGGQDFGNHAATCAKNEAIVGVSMDGRALCRPISNILGIGQSGYLKVKTLDYNNSHGLTANSDQTIGRSRIKFECPRDYYMVGIEAYKEGGYIQSESIACRHSFELAKTPLEDRPCRWVSYESGDNRLSITGGDFARGSWKGQCKDNDYVGGVSYVGRNKYFGGLLCCSY